VSEERNYESEASEQGWTPKENWKGPEEKWTDAQTFVERGEQIAGILKSKNVKLEDRIHRLEESNRQFGEYHKQTLETQQRKNAETIQELEAKVAQAITDGDGAEYTRANREIQSLKSEAPAPTNDAEWSRRSQEFISENEWYNKDPKLRQYADDISDRIRSISTSEVDYFSKLTAEVKEAHPNAFENPNKSRANTVENAGQLSTTNSKDHTYDNLPPDAKSACDKFVKDGFTTREAYVETYEFED